MFANMAENMLSVLRGHFICHISQVRPLIRDKMGWGTKFEWDHHISAPSKDWRTLLWWLSAFLGPVDTYNVALADLMLLSGDGHMFLVTNALSVVSYWQFFLPDVPCWGTTRSVRRDTSRWLRKSAWGYHHFFNPVDRPWPWHDFCQKEHWEWVSTEHWAGKTWPKIKSTLLAWSLRDNYRRLCSGRNLWSFMKE